MRVLPEIPTYVLNVDFIQPWPTHPIYIARRTSGDQRDSLEGIKLSVPVHSMVRSMEGRLDHMGFGGMNLWS